MKKKRDDDGDNDGDDDDDGDHMVIFITFLLQYIEGGG